jgi:hypothetical protein
VACRVQTLTGAQRAVRRPAGDEDDTRKEAATLEYVLNSFNTVSQVTVPTARGLQDALSSAFGWATGPVHRVVPNTWPTPASVDAPTAVVLVGVLVLVVGYLTLRRA